MAKETLAINFVLLPPEGLVNKVAIANSKVKQDNPASFSFDETHFPHVTLYQTFIEKNQLEKILATFSLQKFVSIELEVKDLDTSKLDEDESALLLSLVLKKTESIQDLQNKIKNIFSNFFTQEGTQQSFYLNEKVNTQFIDYVKNFDKDNSGENYSPHITMGIIKKLDKDELYFKQGDKYLFSEIAIVQIGNFGTARKILKRIKLTKAMK